MRIKTIAMSAAVVSAVGRLSALFAAPTIVYPAENAEVKTISDKIWNEIHNESVYFKQATFYQETYAGAYRQSAMKEVSEWQQSGDFSSLLGSDPAAFYKVVVMDEPPTGD